MKRILYIVVFIVAVLVLWGEVLLTNVSNIGQQTGEMHIDPQRAIICTVVTALAGVIIYIVRYIERQKR